MVNIYPINRTFIYQSSFNCYCFFIDEIKSILRRNTLVIMRDYQVAVSSQMETLMPLGAAAEMFNKFLHTEEYSNIYRLPKESEAEDDDSDETEEW